MKIELLLSDIAHISQKYELINKNTGGYFNIFDILNISRDEVCICKFIYELISTNGSHYQGYTYLKLFVENVLHMKFSDYEYKKAVVHKEYVISNGRRIDLAIEIGDKYIPIEVKIYAKDQYKQCFDYYKFYSKNSNVFYLTLDGKAPSVESAKGLTRVRGGGYEEVSQISFEKEILDWLNQCISQAETIKIAPIRETILQFIGVVRSMTNQLIEEKEEEIVSIISSSKENIKTAIEIEKSLKTCKINMIKKVLESIENRLDSVSNLENKLERYSYKSNNYSLVNTYYNKKSSTYPGLSYFIKKLDDEVDLLLRFEIDHRLYVGFCTSKNGKAEGQQLDEDQVDKLLFDCGNNIGGWWIYWEYLPEGNGALSPNFKDFNEAYLNLFDEDKFEKFIDLCEESILKVLQKLK